MADAALSGLRVGCIARGFFVQPRHERVDDVARRRFGDLGSRAVHYALGGCVIDDVDALEDAVAALRPRMLQLDACGSGTTRAHRAAVHRFRALYLELRVSESDAPGCQTAGAGPLTPVVQRSGRRPTGIDDDAVDRWWQQLMP